jgi:hypothetical protein
LYRTATINDLILIRKEGKTTELVL